MNAAEVLIDSASDGLRPTSARELAAILAALPGIFAHLSAGLAGLGEWAKGLGVAGDPDEMIAEISRHAAAAAMAAEECDHAFWQANNFWLDGDDCVFGPVTSLAEDAAAGLIPDDDEPGGYALAALLDSLAEAAELLAEELGALAQWAGDQLPGGHAAAERIAAIAGAAGSMAEAADLAGNAYRTANSFWLTSRNR